MEKRGFLAGVLAFVLLLGLLGAALPACAQEGSPEISDEAIQEFWKAFDPDGYEERFSADHSALLGVGMETFERYDQLLTEHEWTGTHPYEREEVEPGWENIFYNPMEGLFVKAGVWEDSDEKSLVHYLIAANSNQSFESSDLWNLMAIFLKAVNSDLTDLAAHELMRELLYSCSTLDSGVEMGAAYYGPWKMTLAILQGGEGVDGPTLFIAPLEEPIREPWNSSSMRIKELSRRFLLLAGDDGFVMAESPERQFSEDVAGYQYMWEYMDRVWWVEMFFEDMYLGSLINVARASPHYTRADDLYVNMLVAAFPYMERKDAREVYEELSGLFIAAQAAGNPQATMVYDGYVLSMSQMDEQVAVGVINAYDPAALQERMENR